MGRINAFHKLPPEVLEQLKASLKQSGYSDYQGHTEWLQSLGHDISKSSLHRLGMKLEAEDRPPKTPEQIAIMDLRMRALEVAVRMVPPPANILDQADELLEWVG